MRQRFIRGAAILSVLMLALAFTACGPNLQLKAQQVTATAAATLVGAQATLDALHTSAAIPDDAYTRWVGNLDKVGTALHAAQDRLAQGDKKGAIEQVDAGIGFVDDLLKAEVVKLPVKTQTEVRIAVTVLRAGLSAYEMLLQS